MPSFRADAEGTRAFNRKNRIAAGAQAGLPVEPESFRANRA
jgi:hypothetical protein